MVLNGIIQAYRTQIHLTLQGVYAAELGPCEWLIECSYHWKARVYRFSLLYSPLVLLSMTTHTIFPRNERGNKRNPAGSRWWKKLWNLTGQNKTHCRSVDQIVVLPCGPSRHTILLQLQLRDGFKCTFITLLFAIRVQLIKIWWDVSFR